MENPKKLKQELIEKLETIPDFYDFSDIGNEIGIIIGKYSSEDISNFKSGIDHGISLVDGTHP